MSQRETAAGLAKRLHALTCLLGETEPGSPEAMATLAERQDVLDALRSAGPDDHAQQWITESEKLEADLVQRWQLGLESMKGEMHASRQAKRALSAYRSHEASR